jgi:hypothetical protein
MQFRFAALLYCAAALTPFAATAQQRTTGPSPTDSGTAVPAVKYESVFTGYLPFREEKLAPWREVNDEAARVGGHLGIFGGAAGHGGHGAAKPAVQTPAPKPSAPAAPQMMHGDTHGGMKK